MAKLRSERANLRVQEGQNCRLEAPMAKGGWMEGCLEIPSCVLQDIGPLGPLPKKFKKVNSRKSVRWSTVPVPYLVGCA